MLDDFLYCDPLRRIEFKAARNQVQALRVNVRKEFFPVGFFYARNDIQNLFAKVCFQ